MQSLQQRCTSSHIIAPDSRTLKHSQIFRRTPAYRPSCCCPLRLQSGMRNPPRNRTVPAVRDHEDNTESSAAPLQVHQTLRMHVHPVHGLAAHHRPQDRVDVVVKSSRHVHFSGQSAQTGICPLAAYRAHYIGYPTDHGSELELYDAYVLHGPCRLERRGNAIKAHMFAGASLDLYESELGKILHVTAEQLQYVFCSDELSRNVSDEVQHADASSSVALPEATQSVECAYQCSSNHAETSGTSTCSKCLCEAELVGESYALQGEGIVVLKAGKGVVQHNNKLLLRAHSLNTDASILLPKGALLSHPLLMTPETEMTWSIA